MAKSSGKGSMLSGLSDKSAKPVDSSMKPPSGNVRDDATRSSTAEAAATIGPRTA